MASVSNTRGLNVYGTAKRKLRVTRGEAGWESLTFKVPCAESFTYSSRCITRSLTEERLEAFRVVLYCSGAIRVPPNAWPHVLAPDLSRGPLSIAPAAMSARSRAFRGEAGSGSLEAFDPPRLRECVRGAVTKAMGSTRNTRPHAARV